MNRSPAENLFGPILIELHYFPCIAYFAYLAQAERVIIEAHEHYNKQTYRNRCQLLTANKVISLSVPVQKGNRKQLIRDVKVDYSQSWLKDHWRTIASAYGKAPFFEEYSPYFENILGKKLPYLFDLNAELLTMCLRLLNLPGHIAITSQFEEKTLSPVKDLRNVIEPGRTNFGDGLYHNVRYRQNFGSDFVPNLSILDLLFCQGPQAAFLLRQSIRKSLQ